MFGFLRLPHITLRGEGVQMALPVYLLIDTSGSMMGEPITAVTNGIGMLAGALRSDPQAMETAKLSVITFDDQARVVEPLTGIMDFQEPTLQARGSTMMGAGLSLVVDRVKAEVNLGTEGAKGDWRPLLFIMTDGAPSDTNEFEQGVNRLAEVKFGQIVACAAGPHANDTILERITKKENIFKLANADKSGFAAFFKFVSDSVQTRSKSVNPNADSTLPPPPPELTPLS
jgi:uncharacterized protein YegL